MGECKGGFRSDEDFGLRGSQCAIPAQHLHQAEQFLARLPQLGRGGDQRHVRGDLPIHLAAALGFKLADAVRPEIVVDLAIGGEDLPSFDSPGRRRRLSFQSLRRCVGEGVLGESAMLDADAVRLITRLAIVAC